MTLEVLKRENDQLKQTVQAFSAQLRARKQMSDELYEANINLRAINIVQEDQIKMLNAQVEQLKKDANKDCASSSSEPSS